MVEKVFLNFNSKLLLGCNFTTKVHCEAEMAYCIDERKNRLRHELVSIEAAFSSVVPEEIHDLAAINEYLKTAISSNRVILTYKKPLFFPKIDKSLLCNMRSLLLA